jgi:hypothetical protein
MLCTTRTSRGTANSGDPSSFAAALNCSRRKPAAVVKSTIASPLAASGRLDAACTNPGAACAASRSTTSSEIFANRLTRPRMWMKSSRSNSTMSPVAYQPSPSECGGWMTPGRS